MNRFSTSLSRVRVPLGWSFLKIDCLFCDQNLNNEHSGLSRKTIKMSSTINLIHFSTFLDKCLDISGEKKKSHSLRMTIVTSRVTRNSHLTSTVLLRLLSKKVTSSYPSLCLFHFLSVSQSAFLSLSLSSMRHVVSGSQSHPSCICISKSHGVSVSLSLSLSSCLHISISDAGSVLLLNLSLSKRLCLCFVP